jgi:hypothetical protein
MFNYKYSIYNTQVSSKSYEDDSDQNLISIDASKRQRDERLSKVMNQFSKSSSKNKDDDDDGNDKAFKSKSKHTKFKNDYDDDDDDDIVAMMDRMNK